VRCVHVIVIALTREACERSLFRGSQEGVLFSDPLLLAGRAMRRRCRRRRCLYIGSAVTSADPMAAAAVSD
tara:strand:+ start:122 stop:334 length:213 start_codon:yes stop_codon:yes gene_type:complete